MNSGAEPQFLYLSTAGRKTGKAHRIEIWFVESAGRYYVVSERKAESDWVRNILANPKVTFKVSEKQFSGTGRVIDPGTEAARAVSKLMDKKYGWSGGLVVELSPEE